MKKEVSKGILIGARLSLDTVYSRHHHVRAPNTYSDTNTITPHRFPCYGFDWLQANFLNFHMAHLKSKNCKVTLPLLENKTPVECTSVIIKNLHVYSQLVHAHTNMHVCIWAHVRAHTHGFTFKNSIMSEIQLVILSLWNSSVHNSERISYLKEIKVKTSYIHIFPESPYKKDLSICKYYYHSIKSNWVYHACSQT